mmetsp:Transcript_53650/g.143501  ORF Transcript_53650/g.143501 Transcript_53650/m.143501 type:complete len:573 (-) Transcript_53650:275-1993(-)
MSPMSSEEGIEAPLGSPDAADDGGLDPADTSDGEFSTVEPNEWHPGKMMPHADTWMMPVSQESQMLPFWQDNGERPEHIDTILGFRTRHCADFARGHCTKHGTKGNGSQCFHYHFRSQMRRPPVNTVTGRLEYWDVPCQSWIAEPGVCPAGGMCRFAHGMYEVSYHPAKYKTRMCNGHECRGEGICCFAHSEAEHRIQAPAWYSYAVLASIGSPYHENEFGPADLGRLGDRTKVAPHRSMLQKHRFCASYPNVHECARGAACAFAHSREEAATPLLSVEEENHEPAALTDVFFTCKFKTLWCPIGAQHNWQTCVYAHTYQDVRRVPAIGYGPLPCPYWSKKDTRLSYLQRCPLGLRCPYSHGAKEQLYHPKYFRTVVCRDLQLEGCPRQKFCAFYHPRSEQCAASVDDTDYTRPLRKEALPQDWVAYILAPPFFQETGEDERLAPFSWKGRMQGMCQNGAMWGPIWCMPPPWPGSDEEDTTAAASVEDSETAASQESSQALWPSGASADSSQQAMWSASGMPGACYYMWTGPVPMNGGWWCGQSDHMAMPAGVGTGRAQTEHAIKAPPPPAE